MTLPRFLLFIGLALAIAPASATGDTAAQRQAELEALQARIGEIRRAVEGVRGRHDEASRALRSAEEEVGRLGRVLRHTDGEIREHEGRLERLRREQGDRRRDIDDEREALSRQIQGAYRAGREEQIKLLLNQEDPAAFGRMLVYYDYLNRARTERIERIAGHLRRLDELAGEVDAALSGLARARERQRTELQAMESTRQRREQAVGEVERRIRGRGQELTRLEEDEAELQRLIRNLQDALSDIPARLREGRPFSELRGLLPWPTNGRVRQGFGDSRAGGRMRWRGLLIEASEGSDVQAVSHGRVAYAGWLQHYGLVMVLDHGEGYLSLYGHNRSLYREVGDWVNPGEIIGSVGDSGGRDRSGLYFEIRRGSDPVDPVAWLNRR
jgi:septal ring factor EnvC (AmiA/AmiB activator)